MSARMGRVALGCALLALAGCGTPRPWRHVARVADGELNARDAALAEALAHYGRALLAEEAERDPGTGLEEFCRAAHADPTNLPLQLKVAALCLNRGAYSNAVVLLERARRLRPRDVQIDLLRGLAHQAAGEPAAAERAYRRMIRRQPRQPGGYVRLAALYVAERRYAESLKTLDRGLPRVEDSLPLLQTYETLGRLHLATNNVPAAIECFERVRARMPDNPAVLELLARSYAIVGDRARAVAALEQLAALQPDNGLTHYYLGELAEEAGEFAKAAEHFRRATQCAPPFAAAFLRLANLELRTDPARALETLQAALQTLPDEPGVLTHLGLVLTRLRRFEEAIARFQRAEDVLETLGSADHPLWPLLLFWHGSACEQAGQLAEAERLLELCIARYPKAHEPLNYLAYMWAEQGVKLDRALEYITRALELEPEDGAYLDTLGWVYYKRGDHARALEFLQKALRRLPDDPTIAEHVGDALEALNRPREAREYWERSFLLKPDNAKLEEKLRRVGADLPRLRAQAEAKRQGAPASP